MKIKYQLFIEAIILTFLFTVLISPCRAEGPYHFLKEISVSDMRGCKSLLLDDLKHMLYIVCTNKVTILDLPTERVVGAITNTPGISGFAVEPRMGRAFLSGEESKMSIIDLRTDKTVMKINTGPNPAAILFNPNGMEVYAFNQGDDSASVYEADDGDFVKNIKLTGRPKLAVDDPRTGRIYCAVQGKNEIDVIDTKTHTVTNRWPITGRTASGIASDPFRHAVFVVCADKAMLMMDSTNGQVLDILSADQEVDSIAFDAAKRLIVGVGAEGTVSVAFEYTMEHLKMLQTFNVGHKVSAMAIESKVSRIYFATDEKILVYGIETPLH